MDALLAAAIELGAVIVPPLTARERGELRARVTALKAQWARLRTLSRSELNTLEAAGHAFIDSSDRTGFDVWLQEQRDELAKVRSTVNRPKRRRLSSLKSEETVSFPAPSEPTNEAPAVEPVAPVQAVEAPQTVEPVALAVTDTDTVTAQGVAIDLELARIAYTVKLFPVWRAWAVLRSVDASTGGRGVMAWGAAVDVLQEHGVVKNPAAARRLLNTGAYAFFGLNKPAKAVHLRSWQRVAVELRKRAITAGVDTPTNAPGGKRAYVNLAGSVGEVIPRIYAAWLAVKGAQGVTISRATLSALWQTSPRQMLQWEAAAGVQKTANFAQVDAKALHIGQPDIPKHAYLTRLQDGSFSYSWRLPNTYTATAERAPGGQSSRVKRASNQTNGSTPNRQGGNQTGRLYFVASRTRKGTVCAFTKVDKHMRKHGDAHKRRHYALLGYARGVGVWEYASADVTMQHTALDARDVVAERAPSFKALRSAEKRYNAAA